MLRPIIQDGWGLLLLRIPMDRIECRSCACKLGDSPGSDFEGVESH